MPYALIVGLLVLGVVVLWVSVLGAYRTFRRLDAVRSEVAIDLTDRTGMLRARIAGLRVALTQPRR